MLWRTWECIKGGRGGHISCKCSQMLVKVHQLCTCDWKIFSWKAFSYRKLESPCFLLALFTCVLVALSNTAHLGMREVLKKSGSDTSTSMLLSLYMHMWICTFSISFSLLMSLYFCLHFLVWELFPPHWWSVTVMCSYPLCKGHQMVCCSWK